MPLPDPKRPLQRNGLFGWLWSYQLPLNTAEQAVVLPASHTL